MVSLEQIRALEARVEKAVLLIEKLRKENAELEQRLVEAGRTVREWREIQRPDLGRGRGEGGGRIKVQAAEAENALCASGLRREQRPPSSNQGGTIRHEQSRRRRASHAWKAGCLRRSRDGIFPFRGRW